MNNEIKKQRICCTGLTFDQPLYWKASEIEEDKSPEFDKIHLKLGGFHQLMSFMGAGCKLMEDAGLFQLWSTVYKENSIPKMLEGKAYSRCLRACLLTDSALHYMLLQQKEDTNTTNTMSAHQVLDTFDEHDELIDLDGNVFDVFEDNETLGETFTEAEGLRKLLLESLCLHNDELMFSNETVGHLWEMYDSISTNNIASNDVASDNELSEIHNLFSDLKFLQRTSRTGKLWIQYMDFVLIIRMFIRAERTENWNLHIHATEQMMPYFAANGHDKYTKATAKYLEDATNMCECIGKKYNGGQFSITRNDKLFWSGTFSDQIIEQTLMRSGKTQGLINITHQEPARTKWMLSSHVVANYSEALRTLTSTNSGTWYEQQRNVFKST